MAVIVFMAGCTSSHSRSSKATPGHAATTTTARRASGPGLDTEASAYGTILATTRGQTLYALSHETATHLTCTGACLTGWSPLPVAAVTHLAPGVRSDLITHTTRPDGTQQITYGGHPLYTFQSDRTGDITGQAQTFHGNLWQVLDAATGQPASAPPSTHKPNGPAGA
jgi:predicted lipoprotein with Yx(FWY)xxD motif